MDAQKQEEQKDTEVWTFQTCAEHPEFANSMLLTDHLVAAHGGHVRPQGKRHMLNHIDGTKWYGGSDEWTFDFGQGEIKVIFSYRYQRKGEDAAWWGEGPE